MANRVTSAEVKKIIDTTEDVNACIDAANVLVTERLGGTTLSTSHLKEIERWLAAHFVACSIDRQASSVKVGAAQDTYMGQSEGEGLKATTYGQQAIMLDSTGILNKLGKKLARVDIIEIGGVK